MIPHRRYQRRYALPHAASLGLIAAAVAFAVTAEAASPRVVITPAAGFAITWDGNNGGFNSPDVGAGPSNNVALASNGTVAFSSSDLGPELGIPFHVAANLNDGLYGNINSWISGGAPDPYAALRFASPVNISSIAWGRDNGLAAGDSCGGTCTDRAVGVYTLQYTAVPAPDATTPDTGDAATGWITIGTIEYLPGADDVNFASYLRHRFDVAEFGGPLVATGLRIKVSVGGIGGGLDIDEIEVNPIPDPIPPISNFIEITPAAGFTVNWDRNDGLFSTPANPAPVPANDASVSRGATPFTSSDLGPAIGVPFHRAVNLNDGQYGNAFSWIPNFVGGDAAPFAGISFGRSIQLRNVAWGRDNGNVAGDCCGGTLTDRALGIYVVQVTTVANPNASTPEGDWTTVGTINYKANGPVFTSHLRHRFDVLQGGNPIAVTGLRIKVPNANSAIDEIEVNGNTAIEQNAITFAGAAGFSISWDGNDGQFYSPDVGAAPPANRALASAGTIPFTSSDLGPLLGIPFHVAANLNDGLYGNANSWISANGIGGTSDTDPYAALNFGAAVAITNIAWGRDNGNVGGDCCGGTLTDRALGTYRLQYTAVTAPDGTTPETGDAATGWADVGTVTYASAAPPFFTPYLRHRFEVSEGGGPLVATGIRIKVSSGLMDIDEIEVNTPSTPPPPQSAVEITSANGYSITWDGNDGLFLDPAAGAAPPPNRALASRGTTPFTSSDLGPLLGIPFHVEGNLNDGRYGNANSWISANGIGGTSDPDPFAGLNFGGLVAITNIAWSRDNGDSAEGTFTDRALGNYTIQITAVPAPDATTVETGDAATGWVTVGTVLYRRDEPPGFNSHLRHRFELAEGGAPIEATGLRIKVSNGLMDIDEIEVNAPLVVPPAPSIVCPTDIAMDISAGSSVPVSFSVIASDASLPVNCNPAAGSAFAIGQTAVRCSTSDAFGRMAECSFMVVVRLVNQCPVAVNDNGGATVGTAALTINVLANDTDGNAGDVLSIASTTQATHGSVVINGNTVVYTANAGFSGVDTFTYSVSDGKCESTPATVTVSVLTCGGCIPSAKISTDALVEFAPDFEHPVLISCNWWNACLIFDGSLSSNPEGQLLYHLWFVESSPVPFGAGPVATNCLEVGVHTVVLTVTDTNGASDSDSLTLEVVTAPLAIELLMEKINESHVPRATKRELLALLRTALNQSKNERIRPTQTTLDAFEKKVRAKVVAGYPEDGAAWIRWSQAISSGMEKCIKAPVVKKDTDDGKDGEKK